MKRIASSFFLLPALLALSCAVAFAAPLGRATADFGNARPDRNETAWGRLVADTIRNAANTDIALINAGALKAGTLRAGDVSQEQVNALLSFPGDDVVTITITGAQLRAALERAVQAYPTASTAFLHGSGFTAAFNTQAPTNERLTMLRIGGREVQNGDSIRAAMSAPLARGASGYSTIWPDAKPTKSNVSVSRAIANWIKSNGSIAPDNTPRFAPQ